jgi:hypothetical protein
VIATDSFSFYVADIWGAKSSVANVTVEVTKGMYAYVNDDASQGRTAVEGQWSPLKLFGEDRTLHPQNLSFRITSLPSFGALRDPVTKVSLVAGAVLAHQVPFPYTSAAFVEYRGFGDYFNTPSAKWNGSAIHMAPGDGAGADGTDRLAFQAYRSREKRFSSVEVEMEIVVVNVNDCPVLGAKPPDGSSYQATVADDDGDVDDNNDNDGSSGSGSSATTAVGYTWHVLAVGAESEAYGVWDDPLYEPPDCLGNFGLWLGDAADQDVDVVKVALRVRSKAIWRRKKDIMSHPCILV